MTGVQNDNHAIVVGSGPCGVTCAQALLDAGMQVTMLDAGETLEPQKAAIVGLMAKSASQNWRPEWLDAVQTHYNVGEAGVTLRENYGSLFAYALDEIATLEQKGTNCLMTRAKGGFSNVWGAAMLPYREVDFANWPITLDDLKPHYAAIAQDVGLSGRKDNLAEMFPFYAPPRTPLKLSPQAAMIDALWQKRKSDLDARGLFFGQSRLAVKTETNDDAHACDYTGLCLSGCPYGAIYNAAHVVDRLQKHPRFRYAPNTIVKRVVKTSNGFLSVSCHDASGTPLESLRGRRVFLAADAFSAIKIVLSSLHIYDRAPSLSYHPLLLLPLMLLKNFPGIENERLNTLTQLFLEIHDPKVSRYPVHVQISTFNEVFRNRIRSETRRLPFLRPLISRFVLGRLVGMQLFLHSRETSQITLDPVYDRAKDALRFAVSGALSPNAKHALRRAVLKLTCNAPRLGMLPLPFAGYLGKPGDGNHVGAAFPMARNPRGFESDVLGQLSGFERLHIVNAAILPDLPPTTLTYTAMANARRIALDVARADGFVGSAT